MGIVERYIEFHALPTSRKSFLLALLAFPVHLVLALIAHVVRIQGLEEDAFRLVMDAGAVTVLVILFASAWAMRRPGDGRWTVYLLFVLYTGWAGVFLVSLGVYTTPFLAYPFLLPLLVGLWFDERSGWTISIAGAVLSLVVLVLTLTGALPFATALDLRDVDELRNPSWFLAVFFGLGIAAPLVYALCFLTVRTLRLLESRLQEANDRLRATQQLIRRYVPAQIAEQIVSGEDAAIGAHERRRLTLFFSDLVGFTEIADDLEPEELSLVLNEYFSEMMVIAHRYGGTVDELSGDAILVFFGAPLATNDKDHACRAVSMAVDMQRAMQALNDRWRTAGITEQLQVRMGVNTGVVTVGNFGSPERMKYAVLGKHVNLAARLQASCDPGGVLVSHATWLLVQDRIACAAKGEVQLKGLHKPVMTYAVDVFDSASAVR